MVVRVGEDVLSVRGQVAQGRAPVKPLNLHGIGGEDGEEGLMHRFLLLLINPLRPA